MQGHSASAEQLYRQEIAQLAQIEQSDWVRRLTGSAWTDLADVLCDQKRYREAKTAYQASLEIKGKIDDVRGRAIVTGQLGTLARRQGELAEAAERYQDALALFQRINEPVSEAVYWHQLGMVYRDAEHWETAEQAYRQAARLNQEHGLLGGRNGAGTCWQHLGQVCMFTGRLAEAEQWFNKALAAFQGEEDRPQAASVLNNLASLLVNIPARLDEACSLAEESLAIKETFDPAGAEIWNTYRLLAQIAIKQGDSSQAAAYRAKAEQAFAPYTGRE